MSALYLGHRVVKDKSSLPVPTNQPKTEEHNNQYKLFPAGSQEAIKTEGSGTGMTSNILHGD